MNPAEIRKLFDKFGAPLDNDDVWEVQKAIVIKHKALERLAAAANISFDKPQVLRAERDEAVILVHGSMCAADNKNGGITRHEWSVGEARVVRMVDSGKTNKWGKPLYEPGPDEIGNYQVTPKQAAYPFAMAEKRAKDRVILKLAGLHGLYSEDEADEFKESTSAPQQGRSAAPASPSASARPAGAANLSQLGETYRKAMELATTKDDLGEWMSANAETMKEKLGEQEAQTIRGLAAARYRDLPDARSEAAE